jgi:hypothetical protein
MGLEMTKIPISDGKDGWIVLTYEKNIPVCLWISKDECLKLPMIADERICGDTFLKVEKVSSEEYLISDILIYNSVFIFENSTFEQRHEWLKDLLKEFTYWIPGFTKLTHKSDYEIKNIIGYEFHPTENAGKKGYFEEKTNSCSITYLNIPDCYDVENKGYLKVPDIKTSVFLRSKGNKFELRCIENNDGSWSIKENIPDVE